MATTAGINPNFIVRAFPTDEQQAIRCLSRHFYITRVAENIQLGNSNYRSFLMRPAEEVSVALNVEREIVVLFADYETFEARTLQAFDRIYDQFDDVRIDRSIRFLITRDDAIESSIGHYLLQNPEYPIIIPFVYNDFNARTDDFIFNKIRRNFIVRDLFGYQSPLKHEYFFFGREKLVRNVIDIHNSGQNSGLFGLRKSGKTSTIYAIQRRAKTCGCRTLLIDCQDPAIHAKRFGPLLEYIVAETRRTLSLRKIDIDFGDKTDQISENFRKYMNRSLADAGVNVLLIFDEIENISPKTAASSHWREEADALLFWQTLRSFFQSSGKHKLTFCFVGTNPHLFEMPKINDVDNPVYLFAPKTFIPMLSLQDTKEMVFRLGYFMGLDFDEYVVTEIHKRFGGHPFFIRQVCSQIHRNTTLNRPRVVSLTMFKEAERDAGSDIQGYLYEILNTLKEFYPEELEMLEYLARDDAATFIEMARGFPAFVEHLIGYGIVVRRGDDFEFAFDAVAEAVRKTLRATVELTLEEKWKEVSRRRNRIEEEIRTILYRWATRLTVEKWDETRQMCLTGKRGANLVSLSRRELFARNNSPLYFRELSNFVQHCDEFSAEQDLISEILTAMNCVNSERIDAHAKGIDEGDYIELKAALDFLESVFLPPL